ncbi:hypothetical protein B0I35DRAFT_197121 [Stachybotrys elegans]|uniref:Uncharacterized protein n=1 Tax=Stachybotrys elegans TaxID=80388 RepID=A0A8K0WIZ8_9HYPO|nr:hypothetical protein B0I35DRAFT_197121 [Stachybotrys elegans]
MDEPPDNEVYHQQPSGHCPLSTTTSNEITRCRVIDKKAVQFRVDQMKEMTHCVGQHAYHTGSHHSDSTVPVSNYCAATALTAVPKSASDNGTLFRSSLSHDFYQVMVGKADMDLYGWKQLIMWSIEHACVDEAERRELQAMWESQWKFFLENIMKIYGSDDKSRNGAYNTCP